MTYVDDRCPQFPQSPNQPTQCTCVDVYTVQAGDTLYSIAQAYGIPVASLMQCNRILNPYNLKIGTKLCIPGNGSAAPGEGPRPLPTPVVPPQPPATPGEGPNPLPTPSVPTAPACNGTLHTIVAGDTLYMIAKKYRVPLAVIMRANANIDPYNLRIGQQLCIPAGYEVEDGNGNGGGNNNGGNNNGNGGNNNGSGNGGNNGSGGNPVRPPAAPCPGGVLYQTQRGDTLTRIMDRFGVSYDQLKNANPNVDFNGSLETLTLCIPGNGGGSCGNLSPDGCYVVCPGDSLDLVCQKLLIISDALLIANPSLCVSDFSVPGTKVYLPK